MLFSATRKKSIFSLIIISSAIANVTTANATEIEADKVYEYKDSSGAVEFTDQKKQDVQPISEIKVEHMSSEEKANATEKLRQIEQENVRLDEQLEAQRKEELEQQKLREQAKKDKEVDAPTEIQAQHYSNPVVLPRPINPIHPKPLPARPSLR